MKKTGILKTFLALQIGSLILGSAVAASDVTINGRNLSHAEKAALQQQLGFAVLPGNYLSDGNCWINIYNGATGCLRQVNNQYGQQPSQDVDVFSRYGSGSYDNSGNWSHYSEYSEGSVGGSSDGCIYTSFGWSNC